MRLKWTREKLTSWEAFEAGVGMSTSQGRGQSPGLQAFFKGRKAYLDSIPELSQKYPEFKTVKAVVRVGCWFGNTCQYFDGFDKSVRRTESSIFILRD